MNIQPPPAVLRAAVTAVAGAMALGALAVPAGATSDDSTTVHVAAAAPNPTHVGYWLAVASGYFADEGIEIEFVQTQGAPAVLQGLVAGEIQLGLFSLTTALQGQAWDTDLQVIAGLSNRAFDEPVVRTEFLTDQGIDVTTFLELPVSERLAALDGSRWTIGAAGSLTDAKIRYLAQQGGLNPDTDLRIDVVGHNNEFAAIIALEDGSLDASFFDLPLADELVDRGVAVRLLDPTVTDELPIIQQALLTQIVVDAEWARANPETASGIATAVARANRDFHERPVAEVAALLHEHFPELSIDEIATALDAVRPIIPADSRIPADVIEANIQLALLHGAITEPPLASDIYTEEYLPAGSGS